MMKRTILSREVMLVPPSGFSSVQLIAALSQSVPCSAIEEALERSGKRERRRRRLPSALVVQLVIALGLLVDMARRQVLAHLLEPGQVLATKKSISRALYRVGPQPLIALFRALARPLADPQGLPQAFYRGQRLMVLDATHMDVPDTPANEEAFGRRTVGRGKSAFPQVKLVTLMESGTRALVDLLVVPCEENEQAPARELIGRSAAAGMLVLWDAGLYSHGLMSAIVEQGEHFLGRVGPRVRLPIERMLPDGSYESRVYLNKDAREARRGAIAVRVIEYRVGAKGDLVRLVTSLLDWRQAPARELAALYHERWETETFYDEIKTHQQGRPNGQAVALRAQAPAGVIQEIYGLALAHRAIRTLMAASARAEGCDPDRLSFKNALVIVRRHLPALTRASRRGLPPLWPAS